jgi:glycine betaine/choline ABC-type transport system substrate-binding protein
LSRRKSMKHKFIYLLISLLLLFSVRSEACVGRILSIGIVDSVNEKLLAELISVLINERTGTTVNIKVFDDFGDIYDAVKKEEIGVVIENTDHAMSMLNMPKNEDEKKDYDISKAEFKEKLSLTMLKPFGFIAGEDDKKGYYSAVVTEDVLINFPALPRVINKLKNITADKRFNKVLTSVRTGKKGKRAARDFLKKKKLI